MVAILKTHYTRGKSAIDKPSYSGLLLFKMGLLQIWYGLTNYKVTEDRKYEQEIAVTKDYTADVDKEATWLKKG